MAHEVEDPTVALHPENKFFEGDLVRIEPEEGKFGPQLKWIIVLDDDEPYIDETGQEQERETWTWCSQKLTTHEKNKFRQYVKGLTGEEPQVGQLFEEEHYTREFYEGNPSADPEALTGCKQPWRVAVMFTHAKKADGTPYDRVERMVRADLI